MPATKFTRSRRLRPTFTQHRPVLSGFTLVELLVVIAIIALLAAILFPVFARARENARRSSCQSNLKQISLGIKQYVQDYDGRFPWANVGTNGISADNPYGWADAIQPYVKSTRLLQCTSEPGAPRSDPTAVGYTDYFYSSRIEGERESSLQHSSLTIVNGDSATGTAAQWSEGCRIETLCSLGDSGQHALIPEKLNTAPAAPRHLEGHNFAFADGHVKWYKATGPAVAHVVAASTYYHFRSSAAYNGITPFAISGQAPTFHVLDE